MKLYEITKLCQTDTLLSNTLNISLNNLVNSILQEEILISLDNIKILTKLTKNTHLRWRLLLDKLIVQCPYCGNILNSECGSFMCYRCDEISKINSPVLFKMCTDCNLYQIECSGTNDSTVEEPLLLNKKTFQPIIGFRHDR